MINRSPKHLFHNNQLYDTGPKLPMDVFALIIEEHLGDAKSRPADPWNQSLEGKAVRDTWATLQSLSLVCKTFAHICRKNLFEHIEIGRSDASSMQRREKLIAFLNRQEGTIRPAVKSLCWTFNPQRHTENEKLTDPFFDLPRLQSLEISSDGDNDDGSDIDMTSFRKADPVCDMLMGHYLYSSTSTISTLCLGDMDDIPLNFILGSPTLKRLEVYNSSFSYPEFTSTPLDKQLESGYKLEELHVIDVSLLQISAFRFCKSLKTLLLSCCSWAEEVGQAGVPKRVLGPCDSFESVKTLTLRGDIKDWAIIFQTESARKAGIELFPSVTRFHIFDYVFETSEEPEDGCLLDSEITWIEEDPEYLPPMPQLRSVEHFTYEQTLYGYRNRNGHTARPPKDIIQMFGIHLCKRLRCIEIRPPWIWPFTHYGSHDYWNYNRFMLKLDDAISLIADQYNNNRGQQMAHIDRPIDITLEVRQGQYIENTGVPYTNYYEIAGGTEDHIMIPLVVDPNAAFKMAVAKRESIFSPVVVRRVVGNIWR